MARAWRVVRSRGCRGLLVAGLTLGSSTFGLASPGLEPYDLLCDGARDPLGVDSRVPELSWKLRADERGELQTAWQILVASSAAGLAVDRGDVWDSGRVAGDAQLHVPYRGRRLRSAERVFWKLRAWDRSGRPSSWSAVGSWTMGVLEARGWAARWITHRAMAEYRRPLLGFRSLPAADEFTPKWVALDLGRRYPIDSVGLYAVRHTVTEGLGFSRYFELEAANDPSFADARVVADYSVGGYPRDSPRARIEQVKGVEARHVRLSVPRLRREDDAAWFALSQIEVISGGHNVARGARVSASDSDETPPWGAAALTDGLGGESRNVLDNATLRLRREFAVRPRMTRALVQVCGLGQHEMTINGARVGTGLLTPAWTNYEKTCLYDTHDVTALVRAGRNAVGLELAGGMYNVQLGRYVKFVTPYRPLVAIAHLRIEYADGSVETVGSDDRWRTALGPITFSNVFGGEDYDARLEQDGWDRPGFDDSHWTPALPTEGPCPVLRGASVSSPPLREFETLRPVATNVLSPGKSVYDFGQNASVRPRLRVRGPSGSRVKLIPAELVAADGSVDRSSCGHRIESSWNYTLAGSDGGESWSPAFSYHGSRYVQVELTAAPDGSLPRVDDLVAVVVHSDSPPAGEFASSNDLLNRIRMLVRWAQRSNMAHVFTDCPHRERLGWLEQYHLNGPSLRYEFDVERLFRKTFGDMVDAQLASGLVPDIAPEYVIFREGFRDSPEWGGALILAAWQHYLWTGDRELVRELYPAMRRYYAYLQGRSQGRLLSHGLGDWFDLGPAKPGVAQLTPVSLTATAFLAECARTLADVAELLGSDDDVIAYRGGAAEIRSAFEKAFFHPESGTFATGSQTSQAVPLAFGLVPEGRRAAVLEALVGDVRSRGNALTSGDIGYRFLLRSLAEGGRSDVIFDMVNQSERPGYGYQLTKGCTSLAETWTAERTASQNHFMLGQVIEWFYGDLAGMTPDPAAPGFKRVLIRPQPVGDVTWVRASHEGPRGPIKVEWRRERGQFTLHVEIPANSTAEVVMPMTASTVEEGEGPAAMSLGVRLLREEPGRAVFAVESGRYRFRAPMP